MPTPPHRAAALVMSAALLLAGCSGDSPSDSSGDTSGDSPTDGTAQTTPSGQDAPVAPDGRRFVGLDRVVLNVPTSWETRLDACGDPLPDSVVFAVNRPACAVGFEPAASSLFVLDADSPAAKDFLELASRPRRVNDVYSLIGSQRCAGGEECSGPAWTAMLVPSAGVLFAARGEDAVEVLDSLQQLPRGYTTVPFIELGSSADDARFLLQYAGLEADLPSDESPYYVVGTEPPAGSMVADGATVEVLGGDG